MLNALAYLFNIMVFFDTLLQVATQARIVKERNISACLVVE